MMLKVGSIDAVSRKMTNTLRVTVALPTTLAMRHS